MIIDKSESGFFITFYTKIRQNFNENDLNDFLNLQDNAERIKFVSQRLQSFPTTLWAPVNKDQDLALKLKQDGNQAFQKQDYLTAANYYSQSLLNIPWTDAKGCETLCILFANRSAALYHQENYSDCLTDIEQALKLGAYPHDLKYKILDRQARCFLAKKQHLDARNAFRSTLVALDDARGLAPERKIKWQRDVQIMINMLEHGAAGRQLTNFSEAKVKLPQVSGSQNAKFPSASSSLQIEYCGPNEGRLARATASINPGDVLLVEAPHVIALLSEHRKTHCWHCLQYMTCPHPCQTCSDVAFCSPECVKLATHHKYECRFLPAFWESGASITCLLALRAISQAPLSSFKALKIENNKYDLSKIKSYDGSNYATFYNLVSHEEKRSPSDLLHRTCMSIFLLQGLQAGGYFPKGIVKLSTQIQRQAANVKTKKINNLVNNNIIILCGCCFLFLKPYNFYVPFAKSRTLIFKILAERETKELSEEQVYIATLLLHNLQVCQFNSHEVSELVSADTSFLDTGYIPDEKTKSASIFLGGAVYPTLALFNHSCNPGLVRYFTQKGTVVARAIRGVQIGDEVSENYGPIYTRENKEKRRAHLKELYWFDCFCEACEEDWPIFEHIPELQQSSLRLRCGGCGASIKVDEESSQLAATCGICNKKTSVLASLAGLASTEKKLTTAKSLEGKAAMQEYLEILTIFEKFLAPPPTKDYILCQQAIRKCMLQLGNSRHLRR